jgi:glycosyltransferase involved in cell wall biosynthesis
MNLLAIPNDPTKAYFRCSEDEFLGEFNPMDKDKRFFENVYFLNSRDEFKSELYGVKTIPVIKDKKELNEALKKGREEGFRYPMFTEIYDKEKDDIISKARSCNPNVIRTFNPCAMAELGIIVSRELGVPLIISAYDPSSLTAAVREADFVTCETQEVKERCISEYGVNPEKIEICYNGIEEDVFFKREDDEIRRVVDQRFLGYNNVILSCSRIVNGKNLEGILHALSLIKNDFSSLVHLHLGAEKDKKKKQELIKLREKLGLQDISFFLGAQPKQDLPFYYSLADAYVLPSFWEGMNRSLREALFCETPVLTTNYGSTTEYVKDGYNGVLIDPYDIEDIAKGLEKILGNPAFRDSLSSNARDSVIGEHSLKKTMADIVSVYKKVLGK